MNSQTTYNSRFREGKDCFNTGEGRNQPLIFHDVDREQALEEVSETIKSTIRYGRDKVNGAQ